MRYTDTFSIYSNYPFIIIVTYNYRMTSLQERQNNMRIQQNKRLMRRRLEQERLANRRPSPVKPPSNRKPRRETRPFAVANEFIEAFESTVLTMSQARHPSLIMSDVNISGRRGRRTLHKDVKVYKFKVFSADYWAVNQLADNFSDIWRLTSFV